MAHSGHYILQFSCLLYAQNPPNIRDRYSFQKNELERRSGLKKKNRNAERRRRENRGAEGAEGGGVWGAVSPSPPGEGSGEGAVPPPENFFLILDHEITFLAHSGRSILQFSCLLYAQNPAINM